VIFNLVNPRFLLSKQIEKKFTANMFDSRSWLSLIKINNSVNRLFIICFGLTMAGKHAPPRKGQSRSDAGDILVVGD
jgi:hypothetical protein